MPVIDGVFVPNFPLTPAEEQVDWVKAHSHVIDRRRVTERAAIGATRRVAASVADGFGLPSPRALHELEDKLALSLAATARFGFAEARREWVMLQRSARAHTIDDAGDYGRVAAEGLTGVRAHGRKRARAAALGIADAAGHALGTSTDKTTRLLAATAAATKALHLHVLDLIGETLNLGRAAGVMTAAAPPEFALRSEQLDKDTCDGCTRVHGTIVAVGSDEFYRLMPPAECFGAGRCRGIYVFGATPDAMALDEAA